MDNLRLVAVDPETLLAMRNMLKAYLSRDIFLSVQSASTQTLTAKDSTLKVLHTHEHYGHLTDPLEQLLNNMASTGKPGMFVLSPAVHQEYTSIFEKSCTREDFGFVDQETFDAYINPLLETLPKIREVLQSAPSMTSEEVMKRAGTHFEGEGEMGIPSLAQRAYPAKKNFLS